MRKLIRLMLAGATVLALVVILSPQAEARHYKAKRYGAAMPQQSQCIDDNNGRKICGGNIAATAYAVNTEGRVYRQSRDSTVIGGVSPECRPWSGLTCGCEVSLKLFGRVIHSPNLKQAKTYLQVFPRAHLAANMVGANWHHVVIVESVSNGMVQIWDPNSGGRMTRRHTMPEREFLARYKVVDPHGSRLATLM